MSEIDLYLRLPWTIRRTERDDDGHYLVLTIDELDGFLVAARTEQELEQEFWPALEEHLASYLDEGERPPLPPGAEETLARLRPPYARTLAPQEMRDEHHAPAGPALPASTSARPAPAAITWPPPGRAVAA